MPVKKRRTDRETSAAEPRSKSSAVTEPPKRKKNRRKSKRRTAAKPESVMVALDNPNGIRWVLEFAPIYAAILHGIEHGLNERRQQMQVCSVRGPEEFASLLEGRPPDGLLFLASKNAPALKEAVGTIPCVAVLGKSCEGTFDQVTYSNPATGSLPAGLFLKNGLTNVAILGPTEPGRATTFGLRYSAFRETMEDGGGQVLSLLSDDLYEPGNPSNQPRPSEIAALIRKLQTARPRPTGLFVMADNLLPATYAGLIASGIRPGIDLPVVCCNSESPYFAGLLPEPPRVDIPAEEIGRRAVDLLAWRTQNPERQTSTTIFAPTLHIPEGCSFIS